LISVTGFGRTNSKIGQFFFLTGRILPKSMHKKPAMGRISAKLDEIWLKSVVEIEMRAFDRF
jgi:hypothetical protein